MSTCNRLDLQTLGSQSVMPKNLPDHCFTHETECPWPVHFKHSRWWKRQSWSKFATSHYAWGTYKGCMWIQDGRKVYLDSYMASNWIMFHGHLDCFQKPPLGGRPNTKPLGDHGSPNVHNCWFTLFYHVWGPAWIDFHQNSIWLRAQSYTTSHYTWGSVHDHTRWFWKCLGTAFGHFLLGSHNFMVMAPGS